MTKLIKNTSIYTIGNIIPQIANFFLLPLYTSYVTPSEYGIVQSMQVLNSILIVFFTLAIDRSVYRLYFDYKTEEEKKTYFSTIVIALFIISFSVLLIIFSFKNLIAQIYKSIDFYPFYFYAIMTAFFSVYSILPKIYYQINEKAVQFIGLSLFQFISNTTLVLIFVVVFKQGSVGWLKALMLANLLTLPLFIWVNVKTINFKFNKTYLLNSLKFSLPLIPSLLSAWILNLSDRIFIERYFSLYEVGIYSLGYRIAGLVLIISSAFNLAYNPVFYKLASSEDQNQAKALLSKYNFTYLLLILFTVFTITFFAKEVIQLFFAKKYYDSYKIIYLISFAYLISQGSGLFNLSIYQKKKTNIMMLLVLGSALINILLNFLLVPIYGMYGAAYATILSYLLLVVIKYHFAKKYYYIKLNFTKLFFVLVLFLFIITATLLIDLDLITLLILKTFIFALISVVIYFTLRSRVKGIIHLK